MVPCLDHPDRPPSPCRAHAAVVKEALEGLKVWLRLVDDVKGVSLLPPFLITQPGSTIKCSFLFRWRRLCFFCMMNLSHALHTFRLLPMQ